jgi:hypothetical protein
MLELTAENYLIIPFEKNSFSELAEMFSQTFRTGHGRAKSPQIGLK